MTFGEVEAAARAVSLSNLRAGPKPGDLVIERSRFARWSRAVGWLTAIDGDVATGDGAWVIRRLDGTVERWQNASCYALPDWLVEQAVRSAGPVPDASSAGPVLDAMTPPPWLAESLLTLAGNARKAGHDGPLSVGVAESVGREMGLAPGETAEVAGVLVEVGER